MRTMIALLMLFAGVPSQSWAVSSGDVPSWVINGILAVETKSYRAKNGAIVYVDQRRGSRGERGPFQMLLVAWRDVKAELPGRQYWEIETDRRLAEQACRLWLAKWHRGNWTQTIQQWNAGPGGKSTGYLCAVMAAVRRRD